MVLSYTGLRHLALCGLQTNILFHWSREPVLFAPDTRHRTLVHITSWTILHYGNMCGWKLNGITFNWLVYFSGLNLSKWSWQLYISKYLICIMYCAILNDMCVDIYSKYVLKWFISSTFDNCMKCYWPTLGWGTLHCVVCRQIYCLTGW